MPTTLTDTDYSDMAKRRHTINPPPVDAGGGPTDDATARRDFAKRLQALMMDKLMSQSDLARAAAKFMPDKTFKRDNVSLYVRAKGLPGPIRLRAMAKALGVDEKELMPPGAFATVDDQTPPLAMKPIGAGNVWLQVNQAVSLDVAMKVVALISGTHGGEK